MLLPIRDRKRPGHLAGVHRLADSPPAASSRNRTIAIASAIWGASIFLSRIIGLVREQIVGRTLGASREADLYFASFTLPDFLNYLLAAGALSIVFIPIFLEHLQKGDADGGWRAFSVIANFIAVIGTLGIVLMMVFARPLAGIVAPGFTEAGEIDTLVRLMRIILPAQFFHIVGGLLSATLQAQDRHALPATAPLVYSVGIIIGGLLGATFGWGADGFAWGVLVGSIVGPFGLPLYGCLRHGMRWHPTLSFRNPDLGRYLFLSLPIMLGFSIVLVDQWIIKNQASFLPAGDLSYLQYARTLMNVPIGVFGMALGVASYPTLSRTVASGRIDEAYGVLVHAVRLMLVATFAAEVAITLAGFEAVYLIWGAFASRFTLADAAATATVLSFMSIGLCGWAAQTLIGRGFYALGSTWMPTIIGTIATVVLIPLYVVLRQQAGAVGLAIASSVAILAYVLVLGFLQRRRFEREARARGQELPTQSGMLDGAVRAGAAAAIAIAAGLAFRTVLVEWLPGLGIGVVLLRGAVLSIAGIALYAVLARLFGLKELAEVTARITSRLKRRRKAA